MKVSELKKDHLYLCCFTTCSKTYIDIIRYTGMKEYSLYKFIHIVRYTNMKSCFPHSNYKLVNISINKYVTPIDNIFEKYLNLFV